MTTQNIENINVTAFDAMPTPEDLKPKAEQAATDEATVRKTMKKLEADAEKILAAADERG